MEKTYEDLLAEYNKAKELCYNAENALRAYSDGFIYLVCIRSYGSMRWKSYTNPYFIEELVYEYGDGYDGLLEIYSNNPDYLRPDDDGCIDTFKILSLDELNAMSKTNIPMSQAMCNQMMMVARMRK
jgi:hypothetical protein